MPGQGDRKITLEQIKLLAEKISSGVPEKYAAQAAALSESTYFHYKKQAEALIESLDKGEITQEELSSGQLLVIELLESVKRAALQAIERNISLIQVAAADEWQAAAWYLERRYPNEFGRKDRIEHSGNVDSKILVAAQNIADMTPEERLWYAEKLRSNMKELGDGET